MRNQTSFRLTTTLLPTDSTAKATDVINKVDSCGCKFKPTFTEETVVLTNDDRTVMETTRAYSCNWTLCFVKRGLSDDVTATEIANRKLTWNPWTLAFVTAWASDWIDKDDDVTWTGNQTYTGTLTSTCCATYCGDATYKWQLTTEKWVKYPNFASVACLQAYDAPFAWMFATVDDTGELYRYNAVTCCWDMVSSVALWTYEIRCCATAPSVWTADTIVTLVPSTQEIYLGEGALLEAPKYADVLVVWWWWGGGKSGDSYSSTWWGGWAGGFLVCCLYQLTQHCYNVVVGTWGAAGTSWGGCNWGDSKFGTLAVAGWWWWWWPWQVWKSSTGLWSGGWGWGDGISGWKGYSNSLIGGRDWWPWCHYQYWYSGWAWWSAISAWGHGTGTTTWIVINFNWKIDCFSYWGGGACGYSYSSTCCYRGGTVDACWSWWWWGVMDCNACGGKNWIVIVSYPADWSYGYSCATWGTVTTCNWYKLHTFTSNWTFCVVS